MFDIQIYNDSNGKRMRQKSSGWWTNVLNNKRVPISKASRWSHIGCKVPLSHVLAQIKGMIDYYWLTEHNYVLKLHT